MLAPLFFGFVALLAAAKWAIGKFIFRLQHERLALFTSSPILYLPGIPLLMFVIQGVSEIFSGAFYDANGDGYVVLGFNIVFVAAFVLALAAMLLLDRLLVGRRATNETGRASRVTGLGLGLQHAPGWAATLITNLTMWCFWVAVYYATQFPEHID